MDFIKGVRWEKNLSESMYPQLGEILHPGDCYLISHNHDKMLVCCNREGKLVFEEVSMHPDSRS